MKTNELMIGDWVLGSWSGHPCRVVALDENNFNEVHQGSVDVDYLDESGAIGEWVNEIKPIPLTAEILEKNGFVPNTHVYPYPYYEYISKEDKLKIGFAFPQGNRTSYKEPWVYIDSENVFIEHLPCMFVHQLQHVFRLCGLNELADNFKI